MRYVQCSGNAPNATISHLSNGTFVNSFSNVITRWLIPEPGFRGGPIFFQATIVAEKMIYWMDIEVEKSYDYEVNSQ